MLGFHLEPRSNCVEVRRDPNKSTAPPTQAQIESAAESIGVRVPPDAEARIREAWEHMATHPVVFEDSVNSAGRWRPTLPPHVPAIPGDLVARWETNEKNQPLPSSPSAAGRIAIDPEDRVARARVYGLPVVDPNSIDIRPLVSLARDQMIALAVVPPKISGNRRPTVEILELALRRSGIRFGIERDILANAIDRAVATGIPQERVPVARGRHPTRGSVSHFHLRADAGDVVAPGRMIAECLSRGSGRHGVDVLGKILRFDRAEQREWAGAEGVEVDERTGSLIARQYGQVVIEDGVVRISPLVHISSDGLEAEIEIHPFISGATGPGSGAEGAVSEPCEPEDLLGALEAANIHPDRVLFEALDAGLEDARNSGSPVKVRAAYGSPPVDGTDAQFRFYFTVSGADPASFLLGDQAGPIPPADQVMGPNDILVERSPPTDASDGTSVRGTPLPGKPGRDLSLVSGPGVDEAQEGQVWRVSDPAGGIPCLSGTELRVDGPIEVSPDEMTATFPRRHSPPGLVIPTEDLLRSGLEVVGITFGIIEESIANLVQKAGEVWDPDTEPIVLARGRPAQNGAPASYERRIEMENRFIGAEGDEQVDFRAMIHTRVVEEDQIVGVKIAATLGDQNGCTVRGNEIPSRHGEDDSPSPGRGVRLSEDGLSYIADVEGVYHEGEGLVEVLENYVIPGDVDYSVGNIDSRCMVTILGSIETGFSVRAQGPVLVEGSVQDASIDAAGSICIGHGVYRTRGGEIRARGDVEVSVAEHAVVIATGDIQVRREALNADIVGGGSITFGPYRSRAVGGRLACRLGIDADELGSELGVPTEVTVGGQIEGLDDEPGPPGADDQAPRVIARGTVHPGVRIEILGQRYEVTHTLHRVEFYLDPEGQVRYAPLGR